jgi:uncharacterized coiled-coil protein SlyX
MTTIVVPELLAERVYEDVMNELYELIVQQRMAIRTLTEQVESFKKKATTKQTTFKATPRKYVHRRARTYKNHYTRSYGAMVSRLPDDVRKMANQLRDDNGFEAAVRFILQWKEERRQQKASSGK